MSSKAFLEAVKARRSYYPLKKESPVDDKKIQDIVTEALLHTPSSFNNQSTRIVVLLKNDHDKLWEITKTAVKGVVPADGWPASETKLNMFKAAYGTVLFFNDRSVVTKFQENYAPYSDKFPGWAIQTNGITQFAIWTALELEGLGASLQHYNPLIDRQVAEAWDLPKNWELNAQMVFGTPIGEASEKTFADINARLKVFGA